MKKFLFPAFSAVAALALIAFDQLTKRWAEAELAGKGVIPVLGDFLTFIFAKNTGAFLGLGNFLTGPLWVIFMVVLPIAAIVAFTVYIFWKKLDSKPYLILWFLVFAGGVGNLIDRVLVGQVTDFMNMGIPGLPALRTGIFNFADVYIMVALGVILVFGKHFSRPKKKIFEDTPAPTDKP